MQHDDDFSYGWDLRHYQVFCHGTMCSNPIIAEDAKEFVVIMKIFIIFSGQYLNLGDCWFFVFQYILVTQRWKLAEKYAKNACISFNATCV